MKRFLTVLLVIGISGLAYGKQEKRPEPRARETEATQSALKPSRSIWTIFLWHAPVALASSDDPCGPVMICPTGYSCNPDDCQYPPGTDPGHQPPAPAVTPPPN
jgi:hypothetical protein